MTGLSVIIPAHNEAAWIEACLAAVMASPGPLPAREILVAANACSDDTVSRVKALAQTSGPWDLRVIDTPVPGKLNALNLADEAARGSLRVYLDADVRVSPPLLSQLVEALDKDQAAYATGTPNVTGARSWSSRAYARFWSTLPFVAQGTPGFGLFAVNLAGRDRWQAWPDIIADDMFARLQFRPQERTRVAATYDWPPVEGFGNLIRVRRRQNAGVDELHRLYPTLMQNEDKGRVSRSGLLHMALRDPVGFATYAGVAAGVRSPFFGSRNVWARGR